MVVFAQENQAGDGCPPRELAGIPPRVALSRELLVFAREKLACSRVKLFVYSGKLIFTKEIFCFLKQIRICGRDSTRSPAAGVTPTSGLCGTVNSLG